MNIKYAQRSEDTEQILVIQWAQWHLREFPDLKWLHHCPNGGTRNKGEAAKLKQMGVKAGVSDLHLPIPKGIYCGLYIEMKYGDNRQTREQKEFLSDMARVGHFVATCYTAEDATGIIRDYCELVAPDCGAGVMSVPNNSIIKYGQVRKGE